MHTYVIWGKPPLFHFIKRKQQPYTFVVLQEFYADEIRYSEER